MVYLGKNRRVKYSKKQLKAFKKQTVLDTSKNESNELFKEKPAVSQVEIPKIITVRKFSELLKKPVTQVISKLVQNGIMASINESIDFETATIVADDFGVKVIQEKEEKVESTIDRKDLQYRPPVVVILGHVDHGKTTLLDAIRKSDVVSTESGGITQHIGAYQVNWKNKEGKKTLITFLDTPGHEAFSTMRAHGANITDVAILVVSADDGVKPQTKEAISHIKAAQIPVIVAINKIDKPEANIDKVKRELSDLNLIPEDWGGDTVMVPISAKKNTGIDTLLDMVLITTELRDLKADYKGLIEGVVIESHMQSGVGPVATILIKHGQIEKGKVLVIGNNVVAKVRIMQDYLGNKINKATPSTPVKIAGLSDVPNFGEVVKEVDSEREAKNLINTKQSEIRSLDMYSLSKAIKEGKIDKLSIILKADTQGSLEAIRNTLVQLSTDEVKVDIVSEGVGTVNDNDINLAIATKAIILGFKVKIPEAIISLSKEKNIKIEKYDIIYNLFDDIQSTLKGMLKPKIQIQIIGKIKVLKVFYKVRNRKLIGGKVIDGKAIPSQKANIYHSGDNVGQGDIESIQIEQNKVLEVVQGMDCGVAINTNVNIKPDDLIEIYKEVVIE